MRLASHTEDGRLQVHDTGRSWRWVWTPNRQVKLSPVPADPSHRAFFDTISVDYGLLTEAELAAKGIRDVYECDVGPGDTLFLPAYFWHHIQTFLPAEGPTVSIAFNQWYEAVMVPRTAHTYHEADVLAAEARRPTSLLEKYRQTVAVRAAGARGYCAGTMWCCAVCRTVCGNVGARSDSGGGLVRQRRL